MHVSSTPPHCTSHVTPCRRVFAPTHHAPSSPEHRSTQVVNSNRPNAPFNHDTDYVAVARTDGSSRDITLYNYADGTQHSTASAKDGNTLRSVTNADTKICMGWSKKLLPRESFSVSIKGLAVWDARLTDAEVAALLPNFRRKVPSPPN